MYYFCYDSVTILDLHSFPTRRSSDLESIHIIREVAAEFEKPVMLYSIGKDSAVMLRLAQKAFHPGKPPFPLMHVDTTWKFRSEEHTSELQSQSNLVCRLLLEKKKQNQ